MRRATKAGVWKEGVHWARREGRACQGRVEKENEA